MKKLFTTVLLATAAFITFAQQDPQFSQNMFNRLPVNPAYAGSNDAICANGLFRKQWMNFEGAPQTGVLAIDLPIRAISSGIGLTVMIDELGFDKTNTFKLAYAFRFNIGAGKLALGADAAYVQKSLSGDFIFNDQGDPNIPTGGVSANVLDFGAGVYFNTDKFYLGLSSMHLGEPEIDYDPIKTSLVRHYYGMIGANFDLSPTLVLRPNVFVKSDEASTQVDANINFLINNRFWIGGSYRLEDAIVAMAGFNIIDNLRLGYAYDITTSDIKGYSDGSHEIFLGYCFNITRTRPSFMNRNVRFL